MTNHSTNVFGSYGGYGSLDLGDDAPAEPKDELDIALAEGLENKLVARILKTVSQADALRFKDEIEDASGLDLNAKHTEEEELIREIINFKFELSKDVDLHVWLSLHDFDAEDPVAPEAQPPSITLDLEYGF